MLEVMIFLFDRLWMCVVLRLMCCIVLVIDLKMMKFLILNGLFNLMVSEVNRLFRMFCIVSVIVMLFIFRLVIKVVMLMFILVRMVSSSIDYSVKCSIYVVMDVIMGLCVVWVCVDS